LHFQGYLELKRRIRMTGVKKILPKAHLEPRKGDQDDAIKYCSKLETRQEGPWTYGEFEKNNNGKRTDLAEVTTYIQQTKPTIKELAQKYPVQYVRYHRGLEKLSALGSPTRAWKTEITVCIGPPGTGKSTYYFQKYPLAYQWSNTSGKWWDDYQGQETVIMDEFRGQITLDIMKRLGDSTPYWVELKGGSVQFLAKNLIIISNYHPLGDWWDKITGNEFGAFSRRVKDWHWMGYFQNFHYEKWDDMSQDFHLNKISLDFDPTFKFDTNGSPYSERLQSEED